ncbi:MAG: hypothetical protein OXC92_06380 [Flavobacteriaceae bacterium]|nr:hypothetical protein [Flavobacteriaceae bacterium]
MKENEGIEKLFNRLSIHQNRLILLVMGCLLVLSVIISINHRMSIKSQSMTSAIKETSQTIHGVVNEIPLPNSKALERINSIKKALIQLERLNQKPVLSASDSLKFRKILSDLEQSKITFE